jgi:uncharacterized membrane protein
MTAHCLDVEDVVEKVAICVRVELAHIRNQLTMSRSHKVVEMPAAKSVTAHLVNKHFRMLAVARRQQRGVAVERFMIFSLYAVFLWRRSRSTTVLSASVRCCGGFFFFFFLQRLLAVRRK